MTGSINIEKDPFESYIKEGQDWMAFNDHSSFPSPDFIDDLESLCFGSQYDNTWKNYEIN